MPPRDCEIVFGRQRASLIFAVLELDGVLAGVLFNYNDSHFAVLNASGNKVLFYSMLWRDGQPQGLRFVGPQPAARLFADLPLNTDGLKEMIKRLDIVVGIADCMDELDQDEIRTTVLRDIANAPVPQKRDFLERGFEPFLSP